MTLSDLTDHLIRLQTKFGIGARGSWDPDVIMRDGDGHELIIIDARLTDVDTLTGDDNSLVIILEWAPRLRQRRSIPP